MKKFLFFAFVTMLSDTMLPQSPNPIRPYYNYYYEPENASVYWMKILAKDKKIKEVTTVMNRDRYYEDYMALDKAGRITESRSKYKRHFFGIPVKRFYNQKNSYNQYGSADRIQFLKKDGEIAEERKYDYFSAGQIRHAENWRSGKKVKEEFVTFNNDSTPGEYKYFRVRDNNSALKGRVVYEYYSEKQLKEIRRFNSKNKLKHIYKFDCNPKGEIKEQKTTQVCKKTTLDQRGRTVKVSVQTDHKGRQTRNVNTTYFFNGREMTVEHEYYIIKKGKEELQYKTHYADSLEPWFSTTYYHKNRISSERKHEYQVYNSREKLFKKKTFTFYRKGKPDVTYTETFDSSGLPQGAESRDKNNKLLGRIVASFEGDSISRASHYDKKQRLKKVYVQKLSYY